MIAAASSHRKLFENDHARYLEVTIRPGEFVPVHTHRWSTVVYVQSTSDFIRRDNEGRVLFDCTSVVHLLTMELKHATE